MVQPGRLIATSNAIPAQNKRHPEHTRLKLKTVLIGLVLRLHHSHTAPLLGESKCI
jgi:uncharacterized membrane protein